MADRRKKSTRREATETVVPQEGERRTAPAERREAPPAPPAPATREDIDQLRQDVARSTAALNKAIKRARRGAPPPEPLPEPLPAPRPQEPAPRAGQFDSLKAAFSKKKKA